MSDEEFVVAVRMHLGLPVMAEDSCPFCGKVTDEMGEHAVMCKKTGSYEQLAKSQCLTAVGLYLDILGRRRNFNVTPMKTYILQFLYLWNRSAE